MTAVLSKQTFIPSTTSQAGISLGAAGAAPTTPAAGDLWTTTSGLFARINSTTMQFSALGVANSWTAKQSYAASTTSGAGINLGAAGAAPTTPVAGDLWTTTAGMFAYINSATIQFAPIASPAFSGTPTAPTAAANIATTQLATMQAVQAALGGRTAVVDAAATATATSRVIAYTSITAARAVTLPAASTFGQNGYLTVVDESGSCSATNTITINRAGTDTINGGTSFVLNKPYAYVELECNGTNKWTVLDSSNYVGGNAAGAMQAAWQGGAVVANGTYTLSDQLPFGVTITSLAYQVGSAGGSFTVAVNNAGTAVTGLSAVAVSSATRASASATGNTSAAAGNAITVVISGVSGSPTGAILTLNFTRT